MESHTRTTLMAASKMLILLAVFSFSTPAASAEYDIPPADFGLLVNFSVPCDLHTDIGIPDFGGLLTPNLLGVGFQEYEYDGSAWVYQNQVATLYNKTLSRVGSLSGTPDAGFAMSFDSLPGEVVRGKPLVQVPQMFSVPLQLLNATSTSTDIHFYGSADYIQRFGTIMGLAPSKDTPAKKGDQFMSKFAAFYAFYLPLLTSPQLATRVPRCGDERFYGLQNRGPTPPV